MEWSKDDPKTDGVYWWRADRLDFEPDIHSVVVGRFYQIGEMHSCKVEGFGGEWLGPITAQQAEQFDALRKAGEAALKYIQTDPVLDDDGIEIVAALRRALGKQD